MGRAVRNEQLHADIVRRQAAGEAFCVATVVRAQAATAAKAGCKAVINQAGDITGFIGGGCVQKAAQKAAREALREGEARLIRIKPADEVKAPLDTDGVALNKSGCPSRGTVDLFIEPLSPMPLLLIAGASPVAESLAAQAAALGYRVVAASDDADDGEKFAVPVRFHDNYDFSEIAVTERDYAVVATQGRGDLAALRAALQTMARYVAMVCSRAKAASMCDKLQAEGVDAAAIARLKAPAGLHIHAIGADEIALSILAEIIRRRHCDSRLPAAGS